MKVGDVKLHIRQQPGGNSSANMSLVKAALKSVTPSTQGSSWKPLELGDFIANYNVQRKKCLNKWDVLHVLIEAST